MFKEFFDCRLRRVIWSVPRRGGKLKLPTAVAVAGENKEIFKESFSNDYFRVYIHEDIVGIELAGALKNIIAIAAGVVDGLGDWGVQKRLIVGFTK